MRNASAAAPVAVDTRADGHVAFRFNARDFDPSVKKVMGMQMANSALLQAFARLGDVDRHYGLCADPQDFSAFTHVVHGGSGRPSVECVQVPSNDHALLSRVGTLFAPSVTLGDYAWQRRRANQRGYSLCGLTHSIADDSAMMALADLLVAPLQPWDAVICTSQSVRSAVQSHWAEWGQYLGDRLDTAPIEADLQLPVIPLGIDCARYPDRGAALELRVRWRDQLGIAGDDCVFLFSGRLSYHAKANPTPMYQALEAAAQHTGRRLHLIHYGWFAGADIEDDFVAAARTLCPSVRSHFVAGDGPGAGPTSGVMYAADVFTSLSDNIQESFGLTPVEAMAAGLPVVVSDWDGYRDTVRDGRDGFTVPTLAPRPAMGAALSAAYDDCFQEGMTKSSTAYGAYIGGVSLATSVDTAAAARAYIALVEDPAARARLGESGQRRAREIYDWKHIIPRYQDLWRALAERRRGASVENAPPRPGRSPNPSNPDPFSYFRSFPTRAIAPADVIAIAVDDIEAAYARVATLKMASYGHLAIGQETTRRAMLDLIRRVAPCTVAELLARVAPASHILAMRNVAWLTKLGLLSVGTHNR